MKSFTGVSVEGVLIALSRMYAEALSRMNVTMLMSLLTEDYTCVNADGNTHNREHLRTFPGQPPNTRGGLLSYDDFMVRPLGNVAVVTAAYRWVFPSSGGNEQGVVTHVLVRNDAGWQFISSHCCAYARATAIGA